MIDKIDRQKYLKFFYLNQVCRIFVQNNKKLKCHDSSSVQQCLDEFKQ